MRGGERERESERVALCGTGDGGGKKRLSDTQNLKTCSAKEQKETHLCSVGIRRRQRLTHQWRRIVGADMVLSLTVAVSPGRRTEMQADAAENESAAGRERKQVEKRTWKLGAAALAQLSMARAIQSKHGREPESRTEQLLAVTTSMSCPSAQLAAPPMEEATPFEHQNARRNARLTATGRYTASSKTSYIIL